MSSRLRSWGSIAPFLLALTISCGGSGDLIRQDASSTPGATATSSRLGSVQPSPVPSTITPRPSTAAPTEVAPTSTQSIQVTATQPLRPTSPPPTPQAQGPITIDVSAENLTFDRAAISVPANTQVTVNFTTTMRLSRMTSASACRSCPIPRPVLDLAAPQLPLIAGRPEATASSAVSTPKWSEAFWFSNSVTGLFNPPDQ